tara:strand:- start:756 stop:1244 length:489 start_codon:yes stop_codon:yes gene_type:complete
VLEEKILQNSSEKQAKLLGPAQRAHKKPDTGVEINNKSAYYVIRDCAMITQKYLALHIWNSYPDPFESLKGKLTADEIKSFLKKCEKDKAALQLKHVIIGDLRAKFDTTVVTSKTFDYSMEEEDIYKYYSDTEETEDETVVEQEMTEEEMLLKFFDVDPNKL